MTTIPMTAHGQNPPNAAGWEAVVLPRYRTVQTALQQRNGVWFRWNSVICLVPFDRQVWVRSCVDASPAQQERVAAVARRLTREGTADPVLDPWWTVRRMADGRLIWEVWIGEPVDPAELANQVTAALGVWGLYARSNLSTLELQDAA